MPKSGACERKPPRQTMPPPKPKRTVRKHIRPNARRLRSAENAKKICTMIAEGMPLKDAAKVMGYSEGALRDWIIEDRSNGGAEIASSFARAVEVRSDLMADEMLAIADNRDFMGYPQLANAMVTQQRLAVDSRKWLMGKLNPRKYGDRVEVSGDPEAPIVHRIELVAVAPKTLGPPTIEAEAEE